MKYYSVLIIMSIATTGLLFAQEKKEVEKNSPATTIVENIQENSITPVNEVKKISLNSKEEKKEEKLVVKSIYTQYPTDFSDDKKLVGAAHNIFVGTVVKQKSLDQDIKSSPKTQYDVEVIESIKGGLNGMITVNQNGGYRDGVLYVVNDGDTVLPIKEVKDYLLQPGTTYLFMTRYNTEKNWHNMNLYPESYGVITKENLPQVELKVLVGQNKRVQELRAVYPNEILLDADIKNNNALNSYRSTQENKVE